MTDQYRVYIPDLKQHGYVVDECIIENVEMNVEIDVLVIETDNITLTGSFVVRTPQEVQIVSDYIH